MSCLIIAIHEQIDGVKRNNKASDEEFLFIGWTTGRRQTIILDAHPLR